MSIIYFLKSATVNISKYNIKDIPGSSGRLDVISRCVLSAILNEKEIEKDIQIWIFLDNYGTYIFDSNYLNNETFPKNEILLTDSFVGLIKNKTKTENHPKTLESVIYSEKSIFDAIRDFTKRNYKIYVLNESGNDYRKEFRKLKSKDNLLFLIGDQSGDFLIDNELKKMNLTNLSLGHRSYLASSTIRLIKINLQLLV
ncbi:MAG: hypothetical protein EAX91_03260 [Candidatus Lokiarchaeota archaeon]|nr:hypothetical protein [Candidatus Lokiarchaeota archaeon]